MRMLPPLPPPLRYASWYLLPLLLVGTVGCDAPAMGLLATPVEASEPTEDADPLAEFLRSPIPSDDEVDAALEAVKSAYAARDPATALRHLGSLGRAIPAVADWIPLFEAELLAKSGNAEGVRQALDRIPTGSGLRERWGAPSLLDALEAGRGDVPGHLVEAVVDLARSDPDGAGAASSLTRLATRIETGDPLRARSLRIEALGVGAGSRGALAAARALAPGLETGDADLQLLVAKELERHERWSTAVPLRQALLASAPVAEGPAARLALARAQAESGEGTAALRTLGDPGADAEAGAIHVTALYAAGRDSDGAAALRELAARHPSDEATARVLLSRGLAVLDRAPQQARELFNLLASTGHRPAQWDEAALAMGLDLYEAGRYEDAAVLLEGFAEGHPRTGARQQALFWAGLSRGRAGDQPRRNELLRSARAADPVSYYGARAARLTGMAFLPPELPAGPEGPGVLPTLELANAVLRLRVHTAVPTAGSYAFELARLSRHFESMDGGLHALGEAMSVGGLPLHAARFVRSVAGDPGGLWDARLLRAAFPFPYEEEIRRFSREVGLDPFFVAGLIRQESLFQADIQSHAGATGLMQIMPATGRGLARQMGMRGFQPAHLSQPVTNISMGTRYLAEQLRRYGGREADALAAYNAGPGRMNRWRSMPTYGDHDLWVERIPFSETRGYVKSVTLNWSIYSGLYGCGLEGLEFCPHPVTALLRTAGGSASVEGPQR